MHVCVCVCEYGCVWVTLLMCASVCVPVRVTACAGRAALSAKTEDQQPSPAGPGNDARCVLRAALLAACYVLRAADII